MKKTIVKVSAAFLSVLMMVGCASKEKSNTTGWNYNDKTQGGFQVVNNYHQQTPPGMKFVEGGTFTMGRVSEDILGDWNNIPRRVTVSSFYMDEVEISNVNWREYVHWMRMVFGGTPELVERALPDTLVWREELAYNDPYLQYYFSHVAYNEYPVVGVSWEQAMDYSLWRTDRVNELMLVQAGIINFPEFQTLKDNPDVLDIAQNQVFSTDKYQMNSEYQPAAGKHPMKTEYGEERKTNMSDGIMFPKFRLPTEAEWEYAAYALITEEDEENTGNKQMYPWAGSQLRNANKKYRGQMYANFVRGRGDMMGMSGNLNDKALITAPVYSYFPNDFGLYNMAGNVNEWVYDVYRPLSTEDVQEYNPFRGNEYKSPIFTESTVEGNNVRVPQIDSLGRVIYVIDADRETDPAAYAKLDVRNYKDGDNRSGLHKDKWKENSDPDVATKLLYDADTEADGILTSKISNTSRVYKGGSWKDRPYWLNPSTRRWIDQKDRRNDIGFRCAMSKVGPEATEDLK
ncbi:MAG: gliding motility lipoprotein GldJ [Bacteroidales bacterium]|nr:gliding motility lipoprotein GldJ [Bacteroidales bacterium]MBR6310020.1 SUMF1/EgtB/PvdO family nonheme iron enzyme [Paludibacteraceae bacterium]MDD6357681.1 SUMF1/EgtB/PvdO family nonheme iron enzyme [Bacteroidales bacterium]